MDTPSRMIYQTDETRKRILDTAQQLFIEKGLFDLTMKDLASEIGISRASLYRYYRDKLDLSLDVMISVIDELPTEGQIREESAGLENGLEKAFYFLEHHWLAEEHASNYHYLAEFDNYFSGSRVPESFRDRLSEIFTETPWGLLEQYLEEGMKDGSVRDDLDINLASETIQNSLRALHHRVLLRGDLLIDVPKDHLGELPPMLLSFLKEGIRAR